MRSIWDTLSDPGLHLLGLALALSYLAIAGGSWSRTSKAETPLSFCETCHVHYLPEKSCACPATRKIANLIH